MIELLTITTFIGYLVYLRYYADGRSDAQKQADELREGITLYENDQFASALAYFNNALAARPKLAVAYLYRARIYRALTDNKAALAELDKGKSYDDTIADLHLETGQIQFEKRNYQQAFLDFDKAIFYGATAESYYWRGRTRQHLDQPEEAARDLAKAEATVDAARDLLGQPLPTATRFIDRALLIHAGFTTMNALILLLLIKRSPVIHWPYLLAAFSAGAIGFAEPRKGWLLAIWQVIVLATGYWLVVGPAQSSVARELEAFCLYGSIGLTFVGSFLGSILKRAQG
ncbi:hypothetical protein J2I47_17920 [Fibrella sp. HMF5335]|uniref:Tetratricopeptide repeat protein n=1 Tax=Fibrella rubiginis TaxID=2817060 RepID=A0A939GG85_9BACT|nr:hypothetical protein [Fibrella rubiginis]MBO0938434.1 hypothetical protein [Fibrella rubiginis]